METLRLVLPEAVFGLVVFILLVQSMAKDDPESVRAKNVVWTPWAAGLAAVVAGFGLDSTGLLFAGCYKIDPTSQFFKLAITAGYGVAAVNVIESKTIGAARKTDLLTFFGFSAWGLMLLASAVELVTIYVALEISSYALYAMIPLRSGSKEAAESAAKYILFGAAATAVSLFGLSYILAAHKTTYLEVLKTLPFTLHAAPMALVGLFLFLSGFFFKLALFPFHFWAPDVYQGAADETAAFAAAMPKFGAVVVLVRLAAIFKPSMETTQLIAVLGAISMTFGNFAALAQRDVKRLLGWSSVAHAGYMTLGLVSGTADGLAAAIYYSLVYALMNFACFRVVCRASKKDNVTFDDLDGLSSRDPVAAVVLAVSAFALVGLPPTAGFLGKLFLLKAAWTSGWDWLVVITAVNAAIAVYYYLSLVRHAYTKDPAGEATQALEPVKVSGPTLVWDSALALSLIVLGAVPGPVFRLAEAAGKSLLP